MFNFFSAFGASAAFSAGAASFLSPQPVSPAANNNAPSIKLVFFIPKYLLRFYIVCTV